MLPQHKATSANGRACEYVSMYTKLSGGSAYAAGVVRLCSKEEMQNQPLCLYASGCSHRSVSVCLSVRMLRHDFLSAHVKLTKKY